MHRGPKSNPSFPAQRGQPLHWVKGPYAQPGKGKGTIPRSLPAMGTTKQPSSKRLTKRKMVERLLAKGLV